MKSAFVMLFVVANVQAATVTYDGTPTDCQTKINAAASGDTVQCASASAFTWNAVVSVPNTKWITLDGNGCTVTRGSTSSDLIHIDTHVTGHQRITGFTLVQSISGDTSINCISVGSSSFSNARFRIDHCVLSNTPAASPTTLIEINTSYGLVDHCNFYAAQNSELVHNMAYGAGDATGWTLDITPGTIDQVYFEDCTFTNNDAGLSGNPAYFLGNSAIQGYYGCRTVLRYCTLSMSQFDNHGGPIGGRWWEIYSNLWVSVPNANQDRACALRSGSGVVWGNRRVGDTSIGDQLDMSLEASDSATYGPGKGKDSGGGPVSEPVYLWNNDSTLPVNSAQLTLNVGYFLSAKPGYVALTYPHPDIGTVAIVTNTLGSLTLANGRIGN